MTREVSHAWKLFLLCKRPCSDTVSYTTGDKFGKSDRQPSQITSQLPLCKVIVQVERQAEQVIRESTFVSGHLVIKTDTVALLNKQKTTRDDALVLLGSRVPVCTPRSYKRNYALWQRTQAV